MNCVCSIPENVLSVAKVKSNELERQVARDGYVFDCFSLSASQSWFRTLDIINTELFARLCELSSDSEDAAELYALVASLTAK